MRLIGQDVLLKALRKHADARQWIVSWVATVEEATWTSLPDIRADYPSADGVKLKSGLVFNVKGKYRLLTHVNYSSQVVQVLELVTHGEYDQEQWKRRY
jgi:mRNA interferase HigB